MDYYAAVPCKSVAARNKMQAFLAEHFRHVSEFMDWVPLDGRMGLPETGRAICSYAQANDLGWYRNAGWAYEHTHYASCLLRWMALKVGRKMSVREGQIPDMSGVMAHYTLYDKALPFVDISQYPHLKSWEPEGYALCDGLGWAPSMKGPGPDEDPLWNKGLSPWVADIRRRKSKGDSLIRAELERLEDLWCHI